MFYPHSSVSLSRYLVTKHRPTFSPSHHPQAQFRLHESRSKPQTDADEAENIFLFSSLARGKHIDKRNLWGEDLMMYKEVRREDAPNYRKSVESVVTYLLIEV